LLGQACGLFVGISIGTLVMIGGTSVANLRNKVMGYIGSMLGLLLGALTGFGAMGFCFLSLRATALPRFHDAGMVLLGVLFLLLTGISVCYLMEIPDAYRAEFPRCPGRVRASAHLPALVPSGPARPCEMR
jgi:hypothetical protein